MGCQVRKGGSCFESEFDTLNQRAKSLFHVENTRFRFDTLAHAKRWRHSCTNPNTYIVLNVLNVILLENSRIRFPSAARSGRLTGACVDIEERVQGVHVRISAQLGLDRSRMSAMTANASKNCVNLYGLTLEI